MVLQNRTQGQGQGGWEGTDCSISKLEQALAESFKSPREAKGYKVLFLEACLLSS